MKQYIYSNSALHHVVTMVVIFTVSLTFTSTQGFTSPLTGYHSNSPSKRSLTVSSTDNNGASSLLDGQSKTMEALQPQSEGNSYSSIRYLLNKFTWPEIEALKLEKTSRLGYMLKKWLKEALSQLPKGHLPPVIPQC
jgi:hypothetical protein